MSQLASQPKSKLEKCPCCGTREAEVDCWDYRLCYPCWKRWHAEVGVPPDTVRWTEASSDAWRALTREWLAKARAA